MEWYDEENAYCPYCDSTTVIMDSQGYEITNEYLQELMRYADEVDEYEE
ncbi:MAG: hypothetical protein HFE63_10130 [Clostridiales bacterium]|nr:hypothetical protein [Clostridiales bacterium]